MNNKSSREKLIPIIIELELLGEKEYFSPKEKTILDSSIVELKKVMGDSLKYIYTLKKRKRFLDVTISELTSLLDIMEKSCSETQRKTARIEKREKVLNVINKDYINQVKEALNSVQNNYELLSNIPTNEGVIFNEVLKRNEITLTQLLNKLIEKFYPSCKVEQYEDTVKNILYGKVKNPDQNLWNNMLVCLLELSNTDQKDPQQYFQSQFDLYIEGITNSLEEIKIPNLECTITERNQ